MGILSLILTIFTVVELNCENMFDCQHDSLKNDTEWTVDGENHWTFKRYWRKLNRTAQTIIACGGDGTDWMLPDLVALCEVENDTTMRDLTQRSLLRKARYEYVMTSSPDMRGIDVALLYSPFSFRLINSHALRIETFAEHASDTRHTICVGTDYFRRHSARLRCSRTKPQRRRKGYAAIQNGSG